MAYFNSVTNDAVMKERQQAFQQQADRRQLVRLADGKKNEQTTSLKTNILASLCKQAAKVAWLQTTGVAVKCKA